MEKTDQGREEVTEIRQGIGKDETLRVVPCTYPKTFLKKSYCFEK